MYEPDEVELIASERSFVFRTLSVCPECGGKDLVKTVHASENLFKVECISVTYLQAGTEESTGKRRDGLLIL